MILIVKKSYFFCCNYERDNIRIVPVWTQNWKPFFLSSFAKHLNFFFPQPGPDAWGYTVWEYEGLSGSPLWKENDENRFFLNAFQVIDWSDKPVYQKEIPPTFSYLWEITLPKILNPSCSIKLYRLYTAQL